MTNYFSISELVISGTAVPLEVADSLMIYHIFQMNTIREYMGKAITASNSSGYRSVAHELLMSRSGTSQHTFQDIWPNGVGAIDWTVVNRQKGDLSALAELLVKYSNYVRLCMYKTFIHADFKENDRFQTGKKQLYRSGGDPQWKWIKYA